MQCSGINPIQIKEKWIIYNRERLQFRPRSMNWFNIMETVIAAQKKCSIWKRWL